MITQIEGELVTVAAGRARLRCGPITYEILVVSADEQELIAAVGETVRLHTLHYLEGQAQGVHLTPRLIGFLSEEERAFFELFTTVKGIGNRRALRALALPFTDVAEAIAARDVDLLKSLPEIGKRIAESIVTELDGKVDRFIELKPGGAAGSGAGAERAALIRDTVTLLVQLGEARPGARRLVDRALSREPSLDSPDTLLAAALRLRE